MIITAEHAETGLHRLVGEPETYDAQPRYSGLVLTHWPQETSDSRMALAKALAFWHDASTRLVTEPNEFHPATAQLLAEARDYWVPSIDVQFTPKNVPSGNLAVQVRRPHEQPHSEADITLLLHSTGEFTGHFATLREHHIGSNSFMFDDLPPAQGFLKDVSTALIFGDDLKMGRLLMRRPAEDTAILDALPALLRSVGIRLEWT